MDVARENSLLSQTEEASAGTEGDQETILASEEKTIVPEDRAEEADAGEALLKAGNLDRVRNILFGVQARAYEQKFSRLEDQLAREIADLREELRKSSDSLENYIKGEIQSLNVRLKSEEDERNQLSGEMSQQFKEVEEKLSGLGERLMELHRDLNSQILEQSKALRNELRENREEILALLKENVEELRFDKVDHSVLASLFSEMGLRLEKKPRVKSGQKIKESDDE